MPIKGTACPVSNSLYEPVAHSELSDGRFDMTPWVRSRGAAQLSGRGEANMSAGIERLRSMSGKVLAVWELGDTELKPYGTE